MRTTSLNFYRQYDGQSGRVWGRTTGMLTKTRANAEIDFETNTDDHWLQYPEPKIKDLDEYDEGDKWEKTNSGKYGKSDESGEMINLDEYAGGNLMFIPPKWCGVMDGLVERRYHVHEREWATRTIVPRKTCEAKDELDDRWLGVREHHRPTRTACSDKRSPAKAQDIKYEMDCQKERYKVRYPRSGDDGFPGLELLSPQRPADYVFTVLTIWTSTEQKYLQKQIWPSGLMTHSLLIEWTKFD